MGLCLNDYTFIWFLAVITTACAFGPEAQPCWVFHLEVHMSLWQLCHSELLFLWRQSCRHQHTGK